MKSESDKLISKHADLIHSEDMRVLSHVQREDGEWVLHTVMVEGYDVPFKFKRKKKYKSLKGAQVNMTYYPSELTVAGFELEIMKVVRIKRA